VTAPVRTHLQTGAGAPELFAVLTSDAFVQLRATRFRDGATVVRREERPDGGLLLAVARELPDGAPGFLAKLLPKDGRVVQTDVWGPAGADGTRSGTWQVELPGAPARLGGTLRVEPVDGVTRFVREGEAKVSVPLIGGKAESFVAEMVMKLGQKESDLLLELLSS
jgi:hypothetical protein